MDDDQQQRKTSSSATSLPSVSAAAQPQPSTASVPAKGPLISRRVFLVGALGASALLTVASVAGSGGILGPLFPPKEPPTVIAKATDLESKYQAAVSSSDVYTALGDPSNTKEYFSQFFYWPYTISDSPYYKNIVVRLPDDNLGVQLTDRSTVYTAPTGGRFVAYNTTCVHLQCLVNPGFAGTPGSGQFRLQCPCHGSQYNLADGVPVAGPAYDLGLLPLPKVELSIDASGNITATNIQGQVGIGRTSQ